MISLTHSLSQRKKECGEKLEVAMKKIVVLLLVGMLLAGCGPGSGNALQASGLVEATEVAIAPEMSGQVAEVYVSEGDAVAAGDHLLRIEDELLSAQRQAAAASLAEKALTADRASVVRDMAAKFVES